MTMPFPEFQSVEVIRNDGSSVFGDSEGRKLDWRKWESHHLHIKRLCGIQLFRTEKDTSVKRARKKANKRRSHVYYSSFCWRIKFFITLTWILGYLSVPWGIVWAAFRLYEGIFECNTNCLVNCKRKCVLQVAVKAENMLSWQLSKLKQPSCFLDNHTYLFWCLAHRQTFSFPSVEGELLHFPTFLSLHFSPALIFLSWPFCLILAQMSFSTPPPLHQFRSDKVWISCKVNQPPPPCLQKLHCYIICRVAVVIRLTVRSCPLIPQKANSRNTM